ncbi:MAG: hypothetical protein V2B19_31455 [Pseudomonadota bacterium]
MPVDDEERETVYLSTLTLSDRMGHGRASPYRNFAVEMTLREFVAPPLQKTYDTGSGLDLWPLRREMNL